MIDSLRIINSDWLWPVVILSGLLMALLLIKEIRRKDKKQLFIRIILSCLSVILVALMFLKLETKQTVKGEFLALLTEDFRQDQLDSLSRLYPHLEEANYESGFERDKRFHTVFVLGNGIPSYDLHRYDSSSMLYLGAKSLGGIIDLKYPSVVKQGDELAIDGKYRHNHSVSLLLKEEDKVLDSTFLKSDKDDFYFAIDTKAFGNRLYTIQEIDSTGEVINSEPLPVTVEPREKLNILMINQFPTFESKYLKNFLGEEGHDIAIRNELTIEKFKYEYINQDPVNFRYLVPKVLQDIDLIILDAASLDKLSNNELISLSKAISEQGLNLLIQPDDEYLNSSRNRTWDPFKFLKNNKTSVSINEQAYSCFSYSIKSDLLTIPLLSDDNKDLLAAYGIHGSGKIATSLLKNTYESWLVGKQIEYKKLWRRIISGISESNSYKYFEKSDNMPVSYLHESTLFRLSSLDFPMIKGSGESTYGLEKNLLKNEWNFKIWNSKVGWSHLYVENDSSSHVSYYVAGDDEWKALKTNQLRETNARYFSVKNDQDEAFSVAQWKPMNYWWLFCLFVICAGYLWLEPKL